MLALYIWLAASRFEEYRRSTGCICIAESLSQAYLVAPPEFEWPNQAEAVPLERLVQALRTWIA
jgi:hypothetical protein